ncbi:unnamed protein product [Effrenium voratum]|uniref:Ion transport domain-containing protein n=1 Tax=Effrenium voratum TaxID=2562239 RepID=A0AA36NBH9_9DINO|nr:unnamed protein product [Effrenium voratum]
MLAAAAVMQENNFEVQVPHVDVEEREDRSRTPSKNTPDFKELLEQLAAQHERELQIWQERVEKLQDQAERRHMRHTRMNMDDRRSSEEELVPLERPDADTALSSAAAEPWKRFSSPSPHTRSRTDTSACAEDDTLRRSFRTREIWMRHTFSKGGAPSLLRSNSMSQLERKSNAMPDEIPENGTAQNFMRHIIGNPTSPNRMIWDAVGGVTILYDIVTLPLMVFNLEGPFMDTLGLIILVYWTLNVVNQLTCGYLRNGVAVMSPRQIVYRYMTRTVFVDLVTLAPDWTVTIMQLSSTSQNFQEARLLRALRAFRLTRLVRIVKLRWLMEVVRDYLDSEYASIMFEISKMMCLLLVINHVLACAWFALSLVSIELGWTSWSSTNVLDYNDTWWLYDYLTCLHWSLCQFTPASMEVQPANPAERGFATLTVLFALIVFSYIVGSITGSLTQLRMMSETITRETLKLRRFLRRNAVPIGLSLRIRRFVEFELKHRQLPVNQQSVGCLNVLSDQLQSELGFALVQPTLTSHPLFDVLMKSNGGCALLERASQAFHKKTLALDDWEFLPGTPCDAIRYLLSGELRYVKGAGSTREETSVEAGQQRWISEAVLWISDWEYVGEMSAASESNLLIISPKCILNWVDKYPATHKLLRTYANDFVLWLRGLSPEDMSDVLEPIIANTLLGLQGRRKASALSAPW